MNFDSLLNIELSKRKFWEFCNTLEPEFYTFDKPHLIKLCNTLEDFYFSKLLKPNGDPYTKIMIRIPPQHGKSRTLVNFTKWVLGLNVDERIITASNTDSQATDFSRFTRDGIMGVKNMPEQVVYSDIFPSTRVKRGDSAVQKWALEGQHFNYLGVGVNGLVTGKGATLRIMDDIVKGADQALSDTAMDKLWIWLTGTFSSRNSESEAGEVREIFCATLWGELDPQFRLEETEGDEWYVVSMPVYNAETDEMLCEKILSKKAFVKLKSRMLVDSRTRMIFYANYMCEAIGDNENKAFPRSECKTYKQIPTEVIDGKEVMQGWTFAFADTADEGTDNFAMPILQVIPPYVYLIDSIFDQENLTIQESQVLSKSKEQTIRKIVVETNSSGAYFKRRITELLPGVEIYGQWSKANKMARILSMSGIIKYYFRFPENPNPTTEKFMNQVYRLLKTSKKLDDAPDSLSGAAAHLESHFGMFKE